MKEKKTTTIRPKLGEIKSEQRQDNETIKVNTNCQNNRSVVFCDDEKEEKMVIFSARAHRKLCVQTE